MSQAPYITVPAATIDRLEHIGRGLLNLAEGMRRIARPATVVKPKRVPKDQAWFWTKEWQAGEREVDEALAQGEFKEFDTAEEAIRYLHSQV